MKRQINKLTKNAFRRNAFFVPPNAFFVGLVTSKENIGCKGRVAQWIELLSHSRGDAGSNMIRKSRRAHTDFMNNNIKEERKNQAHNLDKAPVSLTGISHEFLLNSENHRNPHTSIAPNQNNYKNLLVL